MTFVEKIKVVLASPTDVKKERDEVKKIVDNINHTIASSLGIVVQLATWESDTYPKFHPEGPQGVIDELIGIESSDILLEYFGKDLVLL